MTIREVLIDEMRTTYDKANKSIILESEIDEELEYIFNKFWRIARQMYGIPVDVYRHIFQEAKQIAAMYEGRYL